MANVILTPAQTLSLQESAQGDYTHKCIISKADMIGAGAVNTLAFTFEGLVPVGKVVSNFAICLVTPFVFSDATILTSTLSIGDASSATTFLSASNVAGTGQTTPVAAGVAYSSATNKAYAATSNLNATMLVTAGKSLSTCTAGEVHVFWQERQLMELCYPTQ